MNWKVFLHSLIAAAVGGAATSVTTVLVNPNADMHQLGAIAGAGAVIGVASLLKQSPLPAIPPDVPPPSPPSNFPTTK